MKPKTSINEENQTGAGGLRSFILGRWFIAWCLPEETAWRLLAGLIHLSQLVLVSFARGSVMTTLSWWVLFESYPDRVWLLAPGALSECEFLNAAVEVFSECVMHHLPFHTLQTQFFCRVLFPAMIQDRSAAQLSFPLQMTFFTSHAFHYAYWR